MGVVKLADCSVQKRVNPEQCQALPKGFGAQTMVQMDRENRRLEPL